MLGRLWPAAVLIVGTVAAGGCAGLVIASWLSLRELWATDRYDREQRHPDQ